mmetsp:Transcript_22655/g.33447  ORF Transcript_22655/g.33447 Transcript_22655/m.33447 type:complete len:150 (+) Transcript_22655:111-560(+)
MMRLYSSIDAVESSPCNNEPSMSQEELEKERQTVEKQMRRLDEKKTRWRLMMQKEKNQSIETSIHSHPSIPSVVYTDGSSGCVTWNSNGCEPQKCCSSCSRKDRIICRQEQSIKSLLKQLKDMQSQSISPVKEIIFENDINSEVSSIRL